MEIGNFEDLMLNLKLKIGRRTPNTELLTNQGTISGPISCLSGVPKLCFPFNPSLNLLKFPLN